MQNMQKGRWLDVAGVVQFLEDEYGIKVSKFTVYCWIQQGRFSTLRLGKKVYIPFDELMQKIQIKKALRGEGS